MHQAISNMFPSGSTHLETILGDLSLRGKRRGTWVIFCDFLVERFQKHLKKRDRVFWASGATTTLL